MAEHNNLYQNVVYYDLIFERDVSREVDFLVAVCRRYAGREPQSSLEVACGPGYHTRALAQRGLRATGLDLNGAMIALAHHKDAIAGVEACWLEADMRQIHLSEPVDVAFCMFDGLDALLTNADLIQHFRAVGASLTKGGIYLVDLTHPRECSFWHYTPFYYAGARDGVSAEIQWATNNPRYDLVSSVAHVELEMRVNDHGQTQVVHDSAKERLLLPQEISLLAELSGVLRVVGWHGDFDLAQPLDDSPASRRMIVILQKQEAINK
ncbi:MAG: class I SAM-dependent methyltransferase [Anaerolineales bacterium]|nr:class I SAM-dependent methyltransferase [Anaerolineales bacterium]